MAIFKNIYLFMNIIFGCAGLCCVLGLSLAAASRGYSLVAVHRLLTAVSLLVAEHGAPGTQASVDVVHGFSWSMACGIFLNQGSNPCPLHKRVDS